LHAGAVFLPGQSVARSQGHIASIPTFYGEHNGVRLCVRAACQKCSFSRCKLRRGFICSLFSLQSSGCNMTAAEQVVVGLRCSAGGSVVPWYQSHDTCKEAVLLRRGDQGRCGAR
jgi:hypothetical protein